MLQIEKEELVTTEVIYLVVNGDPYKLGVQSNWMLDHVLREELGLTGTKEFCGQGACGACAVIIDGRPILSCITLAIECNNKSIETIEGIAKTNHPPLIPADMFAAILGWHGDGDLKSVLHAYEDKAVEVSVPDSNIIFDIDEPDDYKKLLERYQHFEAPSETEPG